MGVSLEEIPSLSNGKTDADHNQAKPDLASGARHRQCLKVRGIKMKSGTTHLIQETLQTHQNPTLWTHLPRQGQKLPSVDPH